MEGPWSDIRDRTCGRRTRSRRRSTRAPVRQAAHERRAGRVGALRGARRPTSASTRMRSSSSRWSSSSSRPASSRPIPTRCASCIAVKASGMPGRGGLLVEERRPLLDPREEQDSTLDRRTDAARLLRRRRLRARLRAGQAAPRDVPDRRPRARGVRPRVLCDRRRRLGQCRRPRPARCSPLASPAPTTTTLLARAEADLVVTTARRCRPRRAARGTPGQPNHRAATTGPR